MSTVAASSAGALHDLDPEVQQPIDAVRRRRARRDTRRERAATVALASVVAGTVVALPLILGAPHASDVPRVLALLVVYTALSRVHFEIGSSGSALPTQLAFVPMLLLLPPAIVPAIVAVATTCGYVLDRSGFRPERAPVALANSAYSIGPALVAAYALETAISVWWIYVALLASQFASDLGATAVINFARSRTPVGNVVRSLFSAWWVDVALAPIGLVAAIASQSTMPYAFLLVLPLGGLLAYFARERKARWNHALELSSAYRGTAQLLGDVVEADDAYTGEHSRAVVELTLAVSDRLGLSPRERRDAEYTALLHDVGKVRIPNAIINKPGALTPEERAVVETHTVEGEVMLDKVGGVLGEVGRLVRSCHERWDGTGYPDGLAGADIPLIARIVCACDAYNAMTTDRPYRRGRSAGEALAELQRCAGTHFDPVVVAALAEAVSAPAAEAA